VSDYYQFLERKSQLGGNSGFEPLWMPDFLFDFQQALVEWAILKGKAALFCDCGLGKTPMQLVWAENVVRKTNGRVLIVTPLAVSDQTIREGAKFGIQCLRSKTGSGFSTVKIIVTNYERLHLFNPSDFVGMVCDESSAIKNFDGTTKALVTEFMRRLPYRLLCTATAAPNDFIELGTSSEALGELGYMDMLGRFFKNDQNSLHPTSGRGRFERGLMSQNKWRFKRHAEQPFWRWVCSWARAVRKPSDLGFDDGRFILPPLTERVTVVKSSKPLPGFLFEMPAVGLKEQREELRHTLKERCEAAAQILQGNEPGVAWCHLNTEGDLLERLIPGALQIKGSGMSDDEKEERYHAFSSGQLLKLVIKPVIGAWGLNWQHCRRSTYFPSHSFEQYYQTKRRFWRFGQTEEVFVDSVTTEGQKDVLLNLQRKARAAAVMFDALVAEMNNSIRIGQAEYLSKNWEAPSWLTPSRISLSA
jgi:hypothetical protein